MTIIRVRLDDEDRKEYGGGEPLPAELVLDTESFKDMRGRELTAIEVEMDVQLRSFLPLLGVPRSRQAGPVEHRVAYLAARLAQPALKWDDFDPRLHRAVFVWEDDANPPAGTSESSSED